jgi:hypothetical protein
MSYDLDFLPPKFATDAAAVHAFLQGKVVPPSPSSDRKNTLAFRRARVRRSEA